MKIKVCLLSVLLTLGSLIVSFAAPAPPVMSLSTNGVRVDITWTEVVGATGYSLLYAPSPYAGPQTIQSKDMGTKTSFSANLWDGAAYYVAVQAYNAQQEVSEYSNIEHFVMGTPTIEINLATDNPPTLLGTYSANYIIYGIKLGQTWQEAWEIVEQSTLFTPFLDPYNPSRFYVKKINPDGSSGETVLYLIWSDNESDSLDKVTVFPEFISYLSPKFRELLTLSDNVDLLGYPSREEVSLDIPSIDLLHTTYSYDSIGISRTVRSHSGEVDVTFGIYTSNNVDDDRDGYTEIQGDCNDADTSINPGATEVCSDGVDQDCDGKDPICVIPSITSPADGTALTSSEATFTWDKGSYSKFRILVAMNSEVYEFSDLTDDSILLTGFPTNGSLFLLALYVWDGTWWEEVDRHTYFTAGGTTVEDPVVDPGGGTNGSSKSVNVTRKESNIYEVRGMDAFVYTRYCYEYVYYDDAVITNNGKIIFSTGDECDVEAFYKKSSMTPGNYNVTVSREDSNWYSVSFEDAFIMTSLCYEYEYYDRARIEVNASGSGKLYFSDGDDCRMDGYYKSTSFNDF